MGKLSRLLNRLFNGRPGETLCARWARTYTEDCLACRIVGWFLSDPRHCWRERVEELKKGRK